MSTPKLVEDFYERIWNDGDLAAAAELLTPGFSFRGSLGNEMQDWERITSVVFVRLSPIITAKFFPASQRQTRLLPRCVSQAVTRRHFEVMSRRGNSFNGWGQRCSSSRRIAGLWVLGDLAGLDSLLKAQAEEGTER